MIENRNNIVISRPNTKCSRLNSVRDTQRPKISPQKNKICLRKFKNGKIGMKNRRSSAKQKWLKVRIVLTKKPKEK